MAMEAGSLRIKGTIDDTEIRSGMTRIKQGFENMDQNVKSSLGSMQRLADITRGLAKGLVIVGTAGVGAMTALAMKAPAIAPELGKIKIGLMKIGRELGRNLKPLFAIIADRLVPAIGKAIELNKDKLAALVSIATQGVKDLSMALSGDIGSIQSLIPKTGMMAIGASIGFKLMGPTGLFIGAALGYAASQAIIEHKPIPSIAIDEGDLGTKIFQVGEAEGVRAKTEAAMRGSPVEFIWDAMTDLINYAIKKANTKQRAMAGKNAAY